MWRLDQQSCTLYGGDIYNEKIHIIWDRHGLLAGKIKKTKKGGLNPMYAYERGRKYIFF